MPEVASLVIVIFASAVFILLDSASGLAGHLSSVLPTAAFVWAVAAVGGLVGSEMDVRRIAEVTLRRLLGLVLVIAGVKLILVRR